MLFTRVVFLQRFFSCRSGEGWRSRPEGPKGREEEDRGRRIVKLPSSLVPPSLPLYLYTAAQLASVHCQLRTKLRQPPRGSRVGSRTFMMHAPGVRRARRMRPKRRWRRPLLLSGVRMATDFLFGPLFLNWSELCRSAPRFLGLVWRRGCSNTRSLALARRRASFGPFLRLPWTRSQTRDVRISLLDSDMDKSSRQSSCREGDLHISTLWKVDAFVHSPTLPLLCSFPQLFALPAHSNAVPTHAAF